MAYIVGIFSCLIPARYRRRWFHESYGMRGPAILSGILQSFFFLVVWILGYLSSFPTGVRAMGKVFVDAGAEGQMTSVAVQTWMGLTASASYLVHPVPLLFLYLSIEGIVRAITALTSGEILPTLPLAAVAWMHGRFDRWNGERSLGPMVPDEVRFGDGREFDVLILSCRPKTDWSRYITVEFQNQFYEIFREEAGPLPRRFTYYLRKNPTGRLVVVVRQYPPAGGGTK